MHTIRPCDTARHTKLRLVPTKARAATEVVSHTRPRPRRWRIEIPVQSFADAKKHCSAQAHRIHPMPDLSPALQRFADRVQPGRRTWLAWMSRHRIRLVVSRLASAARDAVRNAAIHLYFHDMEGQLQAYGTWILPANDKWALHTVNTAVAHT